MKRLSVIFVVFLLAGCAASQQVKDEASRHLRGNCLEMFLANGVGKYQYVANSPTGRVAFALASDENGQSCGMATNMAWDTTESVLFSMPNVDRMEALAIQRCEQKKPSSIKAVCRTFARGNEIVWGKSLNKGMQ
jgi:hypothetical protein